MILPDRDPDETRDVRELIDEVFDNPQWIDLPNPNLGGVTPRELIEKGHDGEEVVRELARAAKHGMTS